MYQHPDPARAVAQARARARADRSPDVSAIAIRHVSAQSNALVINDAQRTGSTHTPLFYQRLGSRSPSHRCCSCH